MTDSIVTPLLQTSTFSDPLTKILRNGAQRFLATAVEEEVLSFIEAHASERLDDGQAAALLGSCGHQHSDDMLMVTQAKVKVDLHNI